MFRSRVTIVTGDHRSDIIRMYMIDAKKKLNGNDKDIITRKDI
ncbi:hypothetical protein ACV3WQ_09965 [Clostridium perfringens]